jgi:hypothetical protein
LQVALFPHESAAVQCTKWVPFRNCPVALLVTVGVWQPPLADDAPRSTPVAEHWPGSVETTLSGGHVKTIGTAISPMDSRN